MFNNLKKVDVMCLKKTEIQVTLITIYLVFVDIDMNQKITPSIQE
jgi:hypothetical protein